MEECSAYSTLQDRLSLAFLSWPKNVCFIYLPFLSVILSGESATVRKGKTNIGYYKALKSNTVCSNNSLVFSKPAFIRLNTHCIVPWFAGADICQLLSTLHLGHDLLAIVHWPQLYSSPAPVLNCTDAGCWMLGLEAPVLTTCFQKASSVD